MGASLKESAFLGELVSKAIFYYESCLPSKGIISPPDCVSPRTEERTAERLRSRAVIRRR